MYTHADANMVDPSNSAHRDLEKRQTKKGKCTFFEHLGLRHNIPQQSQSENKIKCGVRASITVWLGILTNPGMQRFEVKKFSCCLNLGTMLLGSLQFPKHSAHHSFRGDAENNETSKVQCLVFPIHNTVGKPQREAGSDL